MESQRGKFPRASPSAMICQTKADCFMKLAEPVTPWIQKKSEKHLLKQRYDHPENVDLKWMHMSFVKITSWLVKHFFLEEGSNTSSVSLSYTPRRARATRGSRNDAAPRRAPSQRGMHCARAGTGRLQSEVCRLTSGSRNNYDSQACIKVRNVTKVHTAAVSVWSGRSTGVGRGTAPDLHSL